MICGVISSSALRSCWLDGSAFRSICLAALTQRLHLPLFEFGLGEDFAVHLDEHLLDDFRMRCHGEQHDREQRQKGRFHKCFDIKILNLFEQIAQ
jgi:hypothetical protein